MALKTFNPTSPGRRGLVLVDKSDLHKGKPEKSLVEGLRKTGGRADNGRITTRFRGGGAKRLYRVIDFKRRKFDVAGKVERIEYDPNRTAFIALIKYADGELAYILAPQRLKVGDEIVAGRQALRRQDVGQLAVGVLDEGDEGGAIGIVLQALDLAGHAPFPALEVDDAVEALGPAAAETHGDAAAAAAAAGLVQTLDQALLGTPLVQLLTVDEDQAAAGGRSGIELLERHDPTSPS